MPSTRRTGRRVLGASLVAVVAAGAFAGCSSVSSPPANTPSSTSSGPAVPPPLDTCGVTGAWTALPGTPVPAASSGTGPVVVLANDSGNRPCAWDELAAVLVQNGYRAVVFDYSSADAAHEQQSVDETMAVATAAAGGSNRYALIGASLGGRVVIEAAARHPANLAAIVSLSGEVTVEDYPSILAAAGQVTSPALYVGTSDDRLTQGTTQQDALHQAMRGQPNDIVRVAGTKHGTLLIAPTTGDNAPVVSAILGLLKSQLR